MMGYCELSDIEKYLDEAAVIALADDDGDGVADAAVIEEVIASAGADIDAYCSAQYETPFTTVPVIVRRLAAKLAAHGLYLRRTEIQIPEKWELEIKEVRKMLERISRGDLQLGTAASGATGDLCEASKPATDRIFSDDRMGRF